MIGLDGGLAGRVQSHGDPAWGVVGDWEFAGEYSYIDFNTNWQACGGDSQDDRQGRFPIRPAPAVQ